MHKRIIYGVLNWGLGHATRSLVVINQLIKQGHSVVIAADGHALSFLRNELPALDYIELPGYNARYSNDKKSFNTTILKQVPHFLKVIEKEKSILRSYIKKHSIDAVISDNRYGFYSEKHPSFFIGHQLHLRFPSNALVESIMNKIHKKMLRNFTSLWVPDLINEESVSGELTSKMTLKYQKIGLLSTMNKEVVGKKYDVTIVLSGPEPQRTVLEEILVGQLSSFKGKVCFVRGVDSEVIKGLKRTVLGDVYGLVSRTKLNDIMNASELIICRSGYSSVMDLIALDKRAVLIPTPGQTEQEYLSEYLMSKGWFLSLNQDVFELDEAISKSSEFHPPKYIKEELQLPL